MDLLLRKTPAGRALFISSQSSQSAKPFWGLYAATKAALETMVKSYAGELSTTAVTANVFWPGAVRTAMRAKAYPGENPDTLPHPRDIAPAIVDMIEPGFTATGIVYDQRDGSRHPL